MLGGVRTWFRQNHQEALWDKGKPAEAVRCPGQWSSRKPWVLAFMLFWHVPPKWTLAASSSRVMCHRPTSDQECFEELDKELKVLTAGPTAQLTGQIPQLTIRGHWWVRAVLRGHGGPAQYSAGGFNVSADECITGNLNIKYSLCLVYLQY